MGDFKINDSMPQFLDTLPEYILEGEVKGVFKKFKIDDSIRFLNKNTGYVLQGKIKGAFEDNGEFIGVTLDGGPEMKFLDDKYLSCFENNYNKINTSWFKLNDIKIL